MKCLSIYHMYWNQSAQTAWMRGLNTELLTSSKEVAGNTKFPIQNGMSVTQRHSRIDEGARVIDRCGPGIANDL